MHSITDVKNSIHKYQREDLQILTRKDAIQYASTLPELLYQRDRRITEREQRDQRKSTNTFTERYISPTPFVPPTSGQVKLYLTAFCRVLTAFLPRSACLLPAFYPSLPAMLTSMKKIFQRHRRAFTDPFQGDFSSASGRFQLHFSGVPDAVQDHYATLLLIGKGDRA